MSTSTATAPDLSGYEVRFTKTMLGWRWDATAPDASEVVGLPSEILRTYAQRAAAEQAALRAIERHAAPDPPMTGEELRRRVRSRET